MIIVILICFLLALYVAYNFLRFDYYNNILDYYFLDYEVISHEQSRNKIKKEIVSNKNWTKFYVSFTYYPNSQKIMMDYEDSISLNTIFISDMLLYNRLKLFMLSK